MAIKKKKIIKKEPKKMGAPVKYRPEYCKMLIDFMSRPIQEIKMDRTYYDVKWLSKDDIDEFEKDEDGMKRWFVKKEEHNVFANIFPTLERFAHNIGVHRETLREWSTITYPEDYKDVKLRGKLKYPDFSATYTRAIQIQESILVENSLSGNYNAQFAIFLAKNKFGWKDKTETDVNHAGNISISSIEII